MPPLELRTLGGVAVLRDGHPPGSVAAQSKPLALLALLAVAGDHGFTRDKVMALLWPDADIDRGRNVLRQTLYSLRRDLAAPDLFLQHSPALCLNPATLRADLADFFEALAAGSPRRAVDLYHGPFLDGFHLADAPEFERWADGQRDALARRYREALEALAAEAEARGDPVGAAGWWRRLAGEDPLNSRVAVALMRALDKAGEPVAALAVASSHEEVLREELGTGLDASVAEQSRRIRAALSHRVLPGAQAVEMPAPASPVDSSEPPPESPAGSRPLVHRTTGRVAAALLIVVSAGAALYGRDAPRALEAPAVSWSATATADRPRTVAVLPFEDRSPSSLSRYFGPPVTEELSRRMAGVAGLRVVGPGTTAAYGSAGGIARLTSDLRVDGILRGHVSVDDGRVGLSVSLTAADGERTLWSQRYDGGMRDIFAMQSAVVRGVARAMGANLSGAEDRRIERVPTRSAAAYDLYLRSTGLSYVNRVENVAGMALLRQAVSQDSTFAFALAMLARRFMFQAYLVDPAYGDSGMAAVHQALAAEPDLGIAHFALGDLQGLAGQPSAARLSYLKALDLDPGYLPAMVDLSDVDVALGRFDEALYWALRAARLDPTSAGFHFHAGVALYFLGDDEVTERWLETGMRRWPDYTRFAVSRARLDYARARDSAALRQSRAVAAQDPGDEEVVVALAGFAGLIGAPDAEALIAERLRTSPGAAAYSPARESFQALRALALQRRGDLPAARSAADSGLRAAHAMKRSGKEEGAFALELAALYSLRGDTNPALDWLERAYRAGERDYRMTGRDPFFAGLRAERRFQRLLEQMRMDVAAMRERAVAANPAVFGRRE